MSYRIKQLIVIAAILGFILFISHGEYYADVELSAVYEAVSAGIGAEDMVMFDASDIKKDFGFNINDYGEAFYYGYESVMDCECIMVIKLYDADSASYVIEAIDGKRNELKKLFRSYAPEQYELLSSSVLECRDRYILYVVSDNPKTVEKSFTESITG